jgi:hypothetical protein
VVNTPNFSDVINDYQRLEDKNEEKLIFDNGVCSGTFTCTQCMWYPSSYPSSSSGAANYCCGSTYYCPSCANKSTRRCGTISHIENLG